MAIDDSTRDSDDLEALFDSIAAATQDVAGESVTESSASSSMSVNLGIENGDESEEALEALFDSLVSAQHVQETTGVFEQVEYVNQPPSTDLAAQIIANAGDDESDDALEALFDSLVALSDGSATSTANVVAVSSDNVRSEIQSVPSTTAIAAVQKENPESTPITTDHSQARADHEKMINQIGHMARTLHDTLRELGLHTEIEKAASFIPNARDRLNYVAQLTSQAAERVLNATDAAQPVVEKMGSDAKQLAEQWDLLFEKRLDPMQFKQLVSQTHEYLNRVPADAKVTNAHLLDIMMAQDFQDLTGQVIKKITELTNDMERQLLNVLLENAPAPVRAELNSGLLNGPVINGEGRTDVVTSQDQVDDLLESLGF